MLEAIISIAVLVVIELLDTDIIEVVCMITDEVVVSDTLEGAIRLS